MAAAPRVPKSPSLLYPSKLLLKCRIQLGAGVSNMARPVALFSPEREFTEHYESEG